ncbi:MAG: phenylalanine--tRNA ligase subunit beta [Prochlorococcus marinus CUG1438]|nr:phenylalanine--tRNA ligase subunit beta [Prochlorococcus marinus CUG1438]
MKVSQNWLKNLVEITSTPDDLSEKLSIGGFEVESLEDCSENVNGVVLGKVLSVLKHEGSDKLSICQVDIGSSKNLQIICGARNIKPNIYVYVATVGAKLNAVDLTIKRSEIRGVMSEGMICSLQELGLEDSSEGIEIIDEDLALKHELGTPGSELLQLNDFIYDLAITANRPDGMSVIGIAREISALLESTLNFPELNHKYNIHLLKGMKLCPEAIKSDCIYTISCIDGVNGDKLSPKWLIDRIEKSGIKSINLLVDLTNYILLEQGQPLHAFDKEKLSNLIGREVSPEDFSVRKARNNENLVCLDGKKYELNEDITIITCCDKAIAIAGVIGGLETSVTNTTSSIYLEGAVFNPVTIRKSSKAIGIRTESSSRYEKGISSKNTISAVIRAINLLEEYFSINLPIINTSNLINDDDIFIKLRRTRIHKILGPLIINDQFEKRNLSDTEIVDKLTLIGCTLKSKEYGWDVAVIPNRSQDLIREIDLIEEIARLIGYDRFDLNLPNPIKPGKLSSEQLALRKVKNGFTQNGFNEVLSYSLVPEDKETLIKISNPLLLETSCLRDNIWNEHLEIVNRNIKAGQTSCFIFEIGNVFHKNTDFIQEEVLNGVIYGNRKFGKWMNTGNDNDLNYYQARGKLEEALACLNIKIDDKPNDSIDFLHPGRTAKLIIEGNDAGYFGEIHPKLILNKKSLKKVYLFSINVAKLLGASTRKHKWIPIFKQYPTVPKMERDINFIFSKKFLISDITSQIRKTGKNLLEDVCLIDAFEDIKLGDDYISYTFRLSYRGKDKTLLDSDIKSIHSSIISKVEKSFNTKLRN